MAENLEKELLQEWTTAVEALDSDNIRELFDIRPDLLWKPLTPLAHLELDFAHFIQRLEEYKLLGTSIRPVYALHHILYDYGVPNDEWATERIELVDYILKNTKNNELNTCFWGNEENTIMHLAYLLDQPELITLLKQHGALSNKPNKLGHLPVERQPEATLLINKSNAKANNNVNNTNASDRFKRLRELAESPHNNKVTTERQNSTRRYFRPGHLEERKRRVLSEEEEAELKKQDIKRQKEVQQLAQRSAVRNNPLFKKFEEEQLQQQQVKRAPSMSAASAVRERKKLLGAADQIRRTSKVINSLKDRSYVSTSVFRQAQDEADSSSLTAIKRPTLAQLRAGSSSNKDVFVSATDIVTVVEEPTKEPTMEPPPTKSEDMTKLNEPNKQISTTTETSTSNVSDRLLEDKPGVTEQELESLAIGKITDRGLTSPTQLEKKKVDIAPNKVKDIVNVHEHLNDEEKIEIQTVGKKFAVWKKNEVEQDTLESSKSSQQIKAQPPTEIEQIPTLDQLVTKEKNVNPTTPMVTNHDTFIPIIPTNKVTPLSTNTDTPMPLLSSPNKDIPKSTITSTHLVSETVSALDQKISSIAKDDKKTLLQTPSTTETLVKNEDKKLEQPGQPVRPARSIHRTKSVLSTANPVTSTAMAAVAMDSETNDRDPAITDADPPKEPYSVVKTNNKEQLGSTNFDKHREMFSTVSNDQLEMTSATCSKNTLTVDNTTHDNYKPTSTVDGIISSREIALSVESINSDKEPSATHNIAKSTENVLPNSNTFNGKAHVTDSIDKDNNLSTRQDTNTLHTPLTTSTKEQKDSAYTDDIYDDYTSATDSINDDNHHSLKSISSINQQTDNSDFSKTDTFGYSIHSQEDVSEKKQADIGSFSSSSISESFTASTDKATHSSESPFSKPERSIQSTATPSSEPDYFTIPKSLHASTPKPNFNTPPIISLNDHKDVPTTPETQSDHVQYLRIDTNKSQMVIEEESEEDEASTPTLANPHTYQPRPERQSSSSELDERDFLNSLSFQNNTSPLKSNEEIAKKRQSGSQRSHWSTGMEQSLMKRASMLETSSEAESEHWYDPDEDWNEQQRRSTALYSATSEYYTNRHSDSSSETNDSNKNSNSTENTNLDEDEEEDYIKHKQQQLYHPPHVEEEEDYDYYSTSLYANNKTRGESSYYHGDGTDQTGEEGEIVIFMNQPPTTQVEKTPPPLTNFSSSTLSINRFNTREEDAISLIKVPSHTVAIAEVGKEQEFVPHDPNHPRVEDISHYMKKLPAFDDQVVGGSAFDTVSGGLVNESVVLKRAISQRDVAEDLDRGIPNAHEINSAFLTVGSAKPSMEGGKISMSSIESNQYGKMYIGVSGAHNMLLPLPKEITYVRCVISDGDYEYMSRYEILGHQILMDYECVIDTKPGMIITVSLHVRPDYHVKPRTGWSKWFTSIRKQKEHLSGYVHPEDGAIGQTRFAVDHMVPGCYKKTYEANFDCFNSWYARTTRERARREQFGDEEDFLKIVGKLNVEMLYLPVSNPSVQVPRSLRECDLTLKIRQWHDTCWQSGYLSTRRHGTKIWERHYYRLIGSQLVGYTSDSVDKQVWNHYNISDVIRLSAAADKVLVTLVDEQENSKVFGTTETIHEENHKGFFRLAFADYHLDCVSDHVEESEEWVKTLKSMIGRVPLRLPFSD